MAYTIVWTPSGGAPVTLADLDTKYLPTLRDLGITGQEQVEPLAFGATVFRKMRGNLSGQAVFDVTKSHANVATAAAWYKTNVGHVGETGTLVITIGATTLTYANATWQRLQPTLIEGVRWTLNYSFGVKTVT